MVTAAKRPFPSGGCLTHWWVVADEFGSHGL